MKTRIPNVTIQSVATWMPKNKYKCISFCDQFPEKDVKDIIKATGAETIYRADEGEKASDLCYNAADYLLNKENIDRNTIDGLVFVSATRDWIQPDTSISIQHRLGLSTETICQDINYGCAGFIFGLLQASSWIHCGMCHKVLVLTGEVLSPYLNKDSVASIEVSEAGTAAIITEGTSDFGIHISSNGAKSEKIILPYNGTFFQDGMTVFTYGIANAPKSIKAVMELKQWSESDVEFFCASSV
ncbi:MAG TPA: ketoacyl-ACP synthase III [Paludibacteraceae bacterium]|nr:ketoacyl-ACP synthase III [Paludibacteraceae bacterium]HQF50470.1 ketoacyl-ACP synthase III [Paludibacteraceae bacterium]HQJ89388.1 ketoacyl-ACP synthase III [Paludibacteraceae bacterium]